MGRRSIWQSLLGCFCCKCYFNVVHIYHLKHFQDDLLDAPVKVKSASESAAGSSLAAPSDSAEPSGSGAHRL